MNQCGARERGNTFLLVCSLDEGHDGRHKAHDGGTWLRREKVVKDTRTGRITAFPPCTMMQTPITTDEEKNPKACWYRAIIFIGSEGYCTTHIKDAQRAVDELQRELDKRSGDELE